MPLSPPDRADLSRTVRAARARLCTDLQPGAAYITVMAAIDVVQSGGIATPDWLDAALRTPALCRCLAEPTAASWAHQAFHEPDLAALNAQLEAGQLLTAAQIARKTQLFTDAYMVDWLIDNSLGVIWQGMCQKRGWHDTATWTYRVPQRLTPDQLAALPTTLRELRILDPACGTGIFLLALQERLLGLYRNEAALLDRPVEPSVIAEQIVQDNLAGFDIDAEALAVAERTLRRRAIDSGAEPNQLKLSALPAPLGALSVQGGDYHLVIGNPPYLSTRLMTPALQAALPPQTPDLYAAFLRHGLALCAPGGLCAMVTQRGWLFTAQFKALRAHLLHEHRPTVLGDLAEGAFAGIGGAVVSVAMSVIWRLPAAEQITVIAAHQHGVDEKAAALRDRRSTHTVRPSALSVVPGQPLVYWWSPSLLRRYQDAPQLGACAEIRQGMATGHNERFLRRPWEIAPSDLWLQPIDAPLTPPTRRFVPYVKGAAGREWIEGLSDVIDWDRGGLQIKLMHESRYGSHTKRIPSEDFFFRPAVCFTKIGARFSARTPQYRSIFDVAGSAVFPTDVAEVLCLLNSQLARQVLQDLNPTVNFQVGDVRRLPLLPIEDSAAIHQRLCEAFAVHAAATQTSPGFVRLGPSPWRWAQQWAQRAVDRPADTPLPEWAPSSDGPTALDHLSVAVEAAARASGLVFLAGAGGRDSLSEPSTASLHATWQLHPQGASLGDWLRRRFFQDDHIRRYASRPILFPLSSARKTFVALVHLHGWTPQTLPVLLQRHLRPTLARLPHHPARGELIDFIATVERLASRGPEGAERAVPFSPVLSDGVVVNSAAIWPLLHPQWKAPRRWWRAGLPLDAPRSFAWSALARRHFPTLVDELCRQDASLSAVHGCLRRYHPDRAARWGVAEG